MAKFSSFRLNFATVKIDGKYCIFEYTVIQYFLTKMSKKVYSACVLQKLNRKKPELKVVKMRNKGGQAGGKC
jgi:hypothetical protein